MIGNSNVSCCHYLALIATPRPLVADSRNIIIRAINQSFIIRALLVILVTAPLSDIHLVNFTNEIHPIVAIKVPSKKEYIKLMVTNMVHI